jgi:uncharacterized repeat protein (TIGR01451 family)
VNRRRMLTLVLCLFLVSSAFLPPVTRAADMVSTPFAAIHSVTVTNTNDSGPGSLRQAIADAEPGATIQFDLTYPATITLTSGELWISTKDVAIIGPGPELLAISGNHASRVFRLEAHPPYDIHVAISGLTIWDGYTQAVYGGAGLYVGEGILSMDLTDIVFRGNSSGRYGGGMANYGVDEAVLTNVAFYDNSAVGRGGGLFSERGARLTNVAFCGNSAGDGGGLSVSGSIELTNVVFCGNRAIDTGGAFRSFWTVTKLTNVTFSGNWAGNYGGGLYLWDPDISPTIQNSIFWGNHAGSSGDQLYCEYCEYTPTIAYSDIEGSGGSGAGWDPSFGLDGGGNLDVDPRFAGPVDPSTAPTMACDLHLKWGSPAIDAGDNSLLPPGVITDLDGAPRIFHGAIDMGAYESQPNLRLSKTVSDAFVTPGQHITYTITVLNGTGMTITDGLISDALPAGLLPAGPVSLDPPEAGVVGAAPPVLVSDLTINPSQIVTVRLPAAVQEGLATGTVINNTAAFSSTEIMISQTASSTIMIPFRFYLPIVAQDSQP